MKKISMFSPSAKAGLGVGDILVTINDWNIEAMDNIQVRQRRYFFVLVSKKISMSKSNIAFILKKFKRLSCFL